MNEVLNCLETRRSVRKYLPKQITDTELDAVLRAGSYAPSGMGRQSPKIVVLQNPEDIAQLERMNAAALRRSASCWQTHPSPPAWRMEVLSWGIS